jgi:hypothetical protein
MDPRLKKEDRNGSTFEKEVRIEALAFFQEIDSLE